LNYPGPKWQGHFLPGVEKKIRQVPERGQQTDCWPLSGTLYDFSVAPGFVKRKKIKHVNSQLEKTGPQMGKRLTPFLRVIRELHELRELWPHSAALDGFAVYKKAALQLFNSRNSFNSRTKKKNNCEAIIH
jgi:hypothetical protein